jgi:hypothetical protein
MFWAIGSDAASGNLVSEADAPNVAVAGIAGIAVALSFATGTGVDDVAAVDDDPSSAPQPLNATVINAREKVVARPVSLFMSASMSVMADAVSNPSRK